MDNCEAYKAPVSNLEKSGDVRPKKYGFMKRFYISFLWVVPIYMLIAMVGLPKESWVSGAIGAIIFAVFSGILSMLVPAQRKLIFVPFGVVVVFIISAVIGAYMG